MDFIAQKIVRDTTLGKENFTIKVNTITSKIQFAVSLRNKLALAGKKIGFGYEPNVETATRAGLYIIDETSEDPQGCTVSGTGYTQNKYHCEQLSKIYNSSGELSFSLKVDITADNIEGTDVHWLSTEEDVKRSDLQTTILEDILPITMDEGENPHKSTEENTDQLSDFGDLTPDPTDSTIDFTDGTM